VRNWYTPRICEPKRDSQVSHIVVDSSWEQYVAELLESQTKVAAWAKNDHLGFQVLYVRNGSELKFKPDFLVRYHSGKKLVMEIKGQDSEQHRAKRVALAHCVGAVNAHGGCETRAIDVVIGESSAAMDVVERHA
jgi:type III restriction enzyme